MKRYKCYDWYGNSVDVETDDLKEAVMSAISLEAEVWDTEYQDIVFSQWDGWNSDYLLYKEVVFNAFAEHEIEK